MSKKKRHWREKGTCAIWWCGRWRAPAGVGWAMMSCRCHIIRRLGLYCRMWFLHYVYDIRPFAGGWCAVWRGIMCVCGGRLLTYKTTKTTKYVHFYFLFSLHWLLVGPFAIVPVAAAFDTATQTRATRVNTNWVEFGILCGAATAHHRTQTCAAMSTKGGPEKQKKNMSFFCQQVINCSCEFRMCCGAKNPFEKQICANNCLMATMQRFSDDRETNSGGFVSLSRMNDDFWCKANCSSFLAPPGSSNLCLDRLAGVWKDTVTDAMLCQKLRQISGQKRRKEKHRSVHTFFFE